MAKGTQYSKQFKEDAVRYRKDHPELTVQKAAENLGISESALKNWMKAARENEGSVPTRGTGNYSSDAAKEIARLKRELRDTKDALEILKKAIGILGKEQKLFILPLQNTPQRWQNCHRNTGFLLAGY